MRLPRPEAAALTIVSVALGALALAGSARAADGDGYPPGLFEHSPEINPPEPPAHAPQSGSEDLGRDFSGSPPAFRQPGPNAQGAPAGPGSNGFEAPGSPEPPATAEGPPAGEDAPPVYGDQAPAPPQDYGDGAPMAPPRYGSAPPMTGPGPFVAILPGPAPFMVRPGGFGYGPAPVIIHRPLRVLYRRPFYGFPPPVWVRRPAYLYGPAPFARGPW